MSALSIYRPAKPQEPEPVSVEALLGAASKKPAKGNSHLSYKGDTEAAARWLVMSRQADEIEREMALLCDAILTAQSLDRHSTIDLTTNVYTTLTVDGQASALASLPPVPAFGGPASGAGELRATGTEGPKKVPTVVPKSAEMGAVRLASHASEPAPHCTDKRAK